MKKRIITAFTCLAFVGMLGMFAGCGADSSATVADTNPGAPNLQPADHEGRSETGGSNMCYGCHGNGSQANPQLTGATIIPEDHYVDSSYDSKEIDPNRGQCITCHPVS